MLKQHIITCGVITILISICLSFFNKEFIKEIIYFISGADFSTIGWVNLIGTFLFSKSAARLRQAFGLFTVNFSLIGSDVHSLKESKPEE